MNSKREPSWGMPRTSLTFFSFFFFSSFSFANTSIQPCLPVYLSTPWFGLVFGSPLHRVFWRVFLTCLARFSIESDSIVAHSLTVKTFLLLTIAILLIFIPYIYIQSNLIHTLSLSHTHIVPKCFVSLTTIPYIPYIPIMNRIVATLLTFLTVTHAFTSHGKFECST